MQRRVTNVACLCVNVAVTEDVRSEDISWCSDAPMWIQYPSNVDAKSFTDVAENFLQPAVTLAAFALTGRRLADGTMLYGCTCNLSVDFSTCEQDFDVSFTGVRRSNLRRWPLKPSLL